MSIVTDKKAFSYENGQFICHVYVDIPEPNRQILEEVIHVIHAAQDGQPENKLVAGWVPLCDEVDKDDTKLHITLLRGHRAVYYHQIKHLVAVLQSACDHVKPFSICLDKLMIFDNYEKTKQFLSIVTRSESSPMSQLKDNLRDLVDQFSVRLTDEDNTPDTSTHCSVMYRELVPDSDMNDPNETLNFIDNLCSTNLDDYPLCIVRVDGVQLKIGNHVYNLKFNG